MRPLRLLYVDSYKIPNPQEAGATSSDALGYGITSSLAIQAELKSRGVEVLELQRSTAFGGMSRTTERLKWITSAYPGIIDVITQTHVDAIMLFHAFSAFPTEIRRILLDLGYSIPVLGYTHGSHWDPTDLFRFERYPGLELLDLANLQALDRILVVSDYMRNVLIRNISAYNPETGSAMAEKIAVVGLPINMGLINSYKTSRKFDRLTLVFNHAPISSKAPDVFVEAVEPLMRLYDINVLITRRFTKANTGGMRVAELARRFHRRLILGNDMSIPDYYQALWMTDIQVSTATHESLGIATLEAMYTKNCCILPAVGAYSEICGEVTGTLYRPDRQALGEALRYYIENGEERIRLADMLSQQAVRYGPTQVVDRILATLSSLGVG
jgi:glycosyltransferase involved in cell wall biosynthesis